MLAISQAFTGFGAFITLLIGIGMLAVTIWQLTAASLTFNQDTFLFVALGFDLVIIFGSVLGMIGVRTRKGALIFIFQLLVMIFFVAFLAIGIAAFILPREVFNGNCAESYDGLVGVALNSYKNATKQLCTQTCKCSLTDDQISNNDDYSDTEKTYLLLLPRSDSGAKRYQHCPGGISDNQNSTVSGVFSSLSTIEEAFKCSGWCESQLLYRFSDVSNGKPTAGCYDVMKQNLNKYGQIFGFCAFGSAFFMLLVCLCGLCACCAKEQRGRPYSTRFIVAKGGYVRANY